METQVKSKDVIYLARTNFRGQNRLFGIKRKDRRQHMYIIGKSGTGKSTLLHNMVLQDIANGEGLCVVDPHGDLVERLLEKIPEERINDVVYFNPADPDYHIGFNPLELPDPKYKNLVASGLMAIFTKIWNNVWSARMEYILNNAILALLDTPGSTLLGVSRILVDKDYRQQIVSNVKDPVVRAFWINEFEQWQDKFRNEAITPIQNKVGQFLSTSMIRNIVGQSTSTINLFDIMNRKKIFLVNVSKGRIGEDNSSLLGAMIITSLQLSAMERVRIPEEERQDFFLYVDEFQNFATDSFAGILSEARKYRLNLVVAHQYIGQLITDTSSKVRDAIFGNCGTIVSFRVGGQDAEFLLKEFEPELTERDLIGLPNHSLYIKVMVNGVTSRPFSASTIDYFHIATTPEIIQRIYLASQRNYARPRAEVEDVINRWSGMLPEEVVRAETQKEAGKSPIGPQPVTVGDQTKYRISCSLCSKSALVPFEPAPGRPVYCGDCAKKIKAGELEPIQVKREKTEVKEEYSKTRVAMNDLALLGIEFELKEKPQVLKVRKPAPPPKEQQPILSLDKLKVPDVSLPPSAPQTRVERSSSSSADVKRDSASLEPIRRVPDISGLRVALQEALNAAAHDTRDVDSGFPLKSEPQ